MPDSVDCIVVGAGVVGLAVAREMALGGVETLCLEKESLVGTATSSRNSEVIHAGIHYPPGSLKARLCIEGKHRLYRYCEEKRLPHHRCGKIILATRPGDCGRLVDIRNNANRCGVTDLQLLNQEAVRALEPDVQCEAGLWSPSTGIVDSHALMQFLQADLESSGGMVVLRAPIERVWTRENGYELMIGGSQQARLRARLLVNAAGLHAHELANRMEGLAPGSVPEVHYAKGNYFSLKGRNPFSHLLYPVPEGPGLGIHLALDLNGGARFGPDVEWVDGLDYRVDPARVKSFSAAIRRYWPGLPNDALREDYSGIRPKLSGPGQPARDFMIQDECGHGLPGLVNLFGIDSPGLTSSLAIAAHVRSLLLG